MPGAASVIVRRGLILLVTFVLIVIVVSAIVEGTGYSKDIYEAMIREIVRGEVMALRRGGNITEEFIRQYVENRTFQLRIEFGLIDEHGNEIPPYRRMWNLVYRTLTFNFTKTDKVGVANVVPMPAPAPIMDIIAAVLPRTILIVTVADIIVIALALLIGPRIAYRHGSLADRFVVAYAAIITAVPLWWLAMIFIQVFSYNLNWFPRDLRGVVSILNNFWNDPLNNFIQLLWYITLPIIVFVIWSIGSWLYSLRAMLLRVIREDYVMAAKARGIPEKLITRRYILRVSLAPVITSVILTLAGSIGGMIITESIFNWPGMGTLYYAAITEGDSQTLLALSVIYVGVYLVARFILEILYIIIDPRVRVR